MLSWIKFIVLPLIPILIHSLMTKYYLDTVSQEDYFFSAIYIFLGISLLVLRDYLMLKYAPKYPYLLTALYALALWFVISYLVNFNMTGLAVSILATLIAMLIYYLKNRKSVS